MRTALPSSTSTIETTDWSEIEKRVVHKKYIYIYPSTIVLGGIKRREGQTPDPPPRIFQTIFYKNVHRNTVCGFSVYFCIVLKKNSLWLKKKIMFKFGHSSDQKI